MVLSDSIVGIYQPLQISKFCCVQHVVGPFTGILSTGIHVEVHLDPSGGTFFGGDYNDTVGSSRSVDGSSTSVFKYRHGLHILWVDGGHIKCGHTVDHVKGAVVIKGRESPDPYFCRLSWS